MTTHILHEDSHTHGLVAHCPRCREHAEHAEESLDEENLRRLLQGHTYTALDVYAADRLKRLIAQGHRLATIAGEAV